jgi:hypothetical protein
MAGVSPGDETLDKRIYADLRGNDGEKVMILDVKDSDKIAALLLAVLIAVIAALAACGNGINKASIRYGAVYLAPAETGGKWGFIDERGNWVVKPQYFMVWDFGENGLAPVTKSFNGDIGFIDVSGEWAIPTKYAWLRNSADHDPAFSSNGLAAVCGDAITQDYGYINKNGDWVIKPQYPHAWRFAENGLAAAYAANDSDLSTRMGYINDKGEWVITPRFWASDNPTFATNGLAAVEDPKTGLCGYINEKGKWVIEPRFIKAEPFSQNGLAIAAVEDTHDPERGTPLYGYIDEKGKWVIEPQFSRASNFMVSGIAEVSAGSDRLIDTGGRWVDERDLGYVPEYPKRSANGLSPARDIETGKSGHVDKNGQWAIKPRFERVGDFSKVIVK